MTVQEQFARRQSRFALVAFVALVLFLVLGGGSIQRQSKILEALCLIVFLVLICLSVGAYFAFRCPRCRAFITPIKSLFSRDLLSFPRYCKR